MIEYKSNYTVQDYKIREKEGSNNNDISTNSVWECRTCNHVVREAEPEGTGIVRVAWCNVCREERKFHQLNRGLQHNYSVPVP